jgi:hypothetical protein
MQAFFFKRGLFARFLYIEICSLLKSCFNFTSQAGVHGGTAPTEISQSYLCVGDALRGVPPEMLRYLIFEVVLLLVFSVK